MSKIKLTKTKVSLIPEQKKAKRGIIDNSVIFLMGRAGTSKTFTAAAAAIDLLQKKEVSKIIISRSPVEAGKPLGFMPGDMIEKVSPYMAPIISAFEKVIGDGGKSIVDQMLNEQIIEINPPQFMRGWNFENTFVIVDEAQNLTKAQLQLIISRLCNGSKIVFTMDDNQIDIPVGESCYYDLPKIMGIDGVYFQTLEVNHRHPFAIELIDALNTPTPYQPLLSTSGMISHTFYTDNPAEL